MAMRLCGTWREGRRRRSSPGHLTHSHKRRRIALGHVGRSVGGEDILVIQGLRLKEIIIQGSVSRLSLLFKESSWSHYLSNPASVLRNPEVVSLLFKESNKCYWRNPAGTL